MKALGFGLMIVGAFSFLACGGGGGAATPEAAAKALVAGVDAADKAAITAAFPTQAQLAAAMDCEEGKGPWKEIERQLGKLDKELVEMKDMSFELVKFEAKPDRTKTMKAGETVKGCKLKTDITVQSAKMTMKITKDGKSEEDGEGLDLIQLDGKWYVVDM